MKAFYRRIARLVTPISSHSQLPRLSGGGEIPLPPSQWKVARDPSTAQVNPAGVLLSYLTAGSSNHNDLSEFRPQLGGSPDEGVALVLEDTDLLYEAVRTEGLLY